jgi:chromosome segregation ATPase
MTDDTQEVNTLEALQKSLQDKDAMIQDLQSQFTAVKGKADELLDEAKKAKSKAREATSAKEQAKVDKAKRDGDFEQLLKSSETERTTLKSELEDLRGRVSKEKVKSVSMQIASEMADGTNAELLSEFIAQRIKHVDGDTKVLDKSGALTVSSLDELKNEFLSSDRYKSLLRGTKSSGGGAQGSNHKDGSASKVMDRAKFDTLSTRDRADHMASGGTLIDGTK